MYTFFITNIVVIKNPSITPPQAARIPIPYFLFFTRRAPTAIPNTTNTTNIIHSTYSFGYEFSFYMIENVKNKPNEATATEATKKIVAFINLFPANAKTRPITIKPAPQYWLYFIKSCCNNP